MTLGHLHEQYDQFARLNDKVELFWTLASSSPGVDGDPHHDEIRFAVAYLLPKPLHETPDRDENNTADRIDSKGHNNGRFDYWLGFGLSEQGGMIGADIMIYLPPHSSASSSSSSSDSQSMTSGLLLDVHGVSYSFPMLDKCGQDWQLINATLLNNDDASLPSNSSSINAWHVVEAKRSLRSNDVNEDLPFIDDSSTMINPTHVVTAWGSLNLDGDKEESNGRLMRARSLGQMEQQQSEEYLDLTSMILPHEPSGRVSAAVRFFAPTSDTSESRNVDIAKSGSVDEKTNNNHLDNLPYIDLIPSEPFMIPDDETTYKNFCFEVEDFPELTKALAEQNDGQVHIVAFHDILGEAGSLSSLVHHMDLHGTTNDVLGSDVRLCRVYTDLIHPWEAGSPTTFELPQEAGIPLGHDGYLAFRVEVHYHNPRRLLGLTDRSGVRLYYSITKRPHVAGLMLLGDYMLELRGSYTVGSARKNYTTNAAGMRHSFYCPPACFSRTRLEGRTPDTKNDSTNISATVFREVLHMHKSGERMTNLHLGANGKVISASEANRFDFSRGAGYASRTNLPYQINEGESYLTTCYFTTRNVVWGSSSDQEMCQSFLWYYPKNDYSLTCSYLDPTARRSSGSIDSLDQAGCEMGYDRADVAAEFNLDRLNPDEECQVVDSESSLRAFENFGSLPASDLKLWPSLLQLVNTWKQKMDTGKLTSEHANSTEASRSGNDATPSSVSSVSNKHQNEDNCYLCPNGQRPTQPDAIVTGFSWTCDELDAAIPVLYTQPELLLLSTSDIAPCEAYRAKFGELCGCPEAMDEPELVVRSPALRQRSKEWLLRGSAVRATGTLLVLALLSLFFLPRIYPSRIVSQNS